MVGTDSETRSEKLGGWKAIARYLGRDRATAMRWEVSRGLPVHRVPGGGRASVYAFGEELDEWLGRITGRDTDRSPDNPVDDASPGLGRRAMLTGTFGLAAAAVLGVASYRRFAQGTEVDTLLVQARFLRSQNTFETQNQAIGLAREAVRIDPGNADAWGELAYFEATASRWRPETLSRSLRDQAMIHGQRALQIDPGNAKGELALATAYPLLGEDNWLARANGLKRALASGPKDPDVIFEYAWILRHTGHCRQSASMCETLEPVARTAPVYNSWSRALWSSGQADRSDQLIAKAMQLYPTNKMLWFSNIEMLLFGGKPEIAAAMAEDRRQRPTLVGDPEVAEIVEVASALAGPSEARIDEILQQLRESARTSIRAARNAVRVAAISRRPDEAIAILRAHFFGEGFEVGENIGSGLSIPPSQRHTNFLFEPPISSLWKEPGFGEILDQVGLERFWRVTRIPPDFRTM